MTFGAKCPALGARGAEIYSDLEQECPRADAFEIGDLVLQFFDLVTNLCSGLRVGFQPFQKLPEPNEVGFSGRSHHKADRSRSVRHEKWFSTHK